MNVATGFEHEATECLVSYLKSTGHLDATRLCSSLNVPSDGKLLEVDGVVVASGCAVVLEAKNSLNEAAATQLELRLHIIECARPVMCVATAVVSHSCAGN